MGLPSLRYCAYIWSCSSDGKSNKGNYPWYEYMPFIPKDKLHSNCPLPKPVFIPTELEWNRIVSADKNTRSGRSCLARVIHISEKFWETGCFHIWSRRVFLGRLRSFESSVPTRNTAMTLVSNGNLGLNPKLGQTPRLESGLNHTQWLASCQSLPGMYLEDLASVL